MSDFSEPSGPTFGDMIARGSAAPQPPPYVPPPAPPVPANASEAMARMETLRNDPAWRDKVLSGDGAATKEFNNLTQMIAGADDIDRAIAGIPDEGIFQRSEQVVMTGTAAMLRDLGFGPTAIRETLTGEGVPQEDYDRAVRWKASAMRSKDFTERYLGGDLDAAREMAAANVCIANGIKKGG